MKGRLRVLFERDPHCFWCEIRTVPISCPEESHVPDGATYDHLITKARARTLDEHSFGPAVLACNECNQLRNLIESKSLVGKTVSEERLERWVLRASRGRAEETCAEAASAAFASAMAAQLQTQFYHLRALFRIDPHCFWCECVTVLKPDQKISGRPNAATLDPLGADLGADGAQHPEGPVILACHACQQLRIAIASGRQIPEVRFRSWRERAAGSKLNPGQRRRKRQRRLKRTRCMRTAEAKNHTGLPIAA